MALSSLPGHDALSACKRARVAPIFGSVISSNNVMLFTKEWEKDKTHRFTFCAKCLKELIAF